MIYVNPSGKLICSNYLFPITIWNFNFIWKTTHIKMVKAFVRFLIDWKIFVGQFKWTHEMLIGYNSMVVFVVILIHIIRGKNSIAFCLPLWIALLLPWEWIFHWNRNLCCIQFTKTYSRCFFVDWFIFTQLSFSCTYACIYLPTQPCSSIRCSKMNTNWNIGLKPNCLQIILKYVGQVFTGLI